MVVGTGACAVVLLAALSASACVMLVSRWRRDRASWRLEQERLNDEIWELRAAAAALDKAQAASEAKSRFLATVSHEVRTPLNGIIGMADLLRDTGLSDEQRAYVSAVRTSGEALAALIDEILDFSRIESGRIDLAHEPFDLPLLVEGVVELLGPRAQDKGLEIAARIGRSVPCSVVGDGARLRQVLMNLAGNAIKFTEAGGLGIRVDYEGGRVRFAVSDTGPGVPPDRRDAIFAEFEQADNSTTRRHGGTGLGLAISQRIVAALGGELRYLPRPQGGSEFAFAIPFETGVAPPGALQRRACPDLSGHVALVASAAPFTADFLAEELADCGARVERVRDAAEAAALLDRMSGGADLALVDAALGITAAKALADLVRSRQSGRVVMLLSPRERQAWGDVLLPMGDGWLVKPIRARSLVERLRPAAERKVSAGSATFTARPDASGTSNARVLLAEDNPVNALIARRSLERLGAEVVHTSDGVATLQAINDTLGGDGPNFDLVLMDVSMPGLDGLEVTRQIRASEARLGAPSLRIVALTAHALDEHRSACRQAGMDEVLTKPIAPDVFRRVLEDGSPQAAAG